VRSAGDLAQHGVAFDRGPTVPAANFLYDSNGSAAVRLKLAGSTAQGFSALAQADAGALVEFADASSTLVVYSGLRQSGMRDTRSVAAGLVRLYWAGKWSKDVVAGPMTIADVAGAATVARASQVGLQWVGSDVTPFHRVVRLRRSWLNGVKAQYGPHQPGLGAAPQPVPPILVEEARDEPTLVVEAVSAVEQPPPPAEVPEEETVP
jgi:hypothetical protein